LADTKNKCVEATQVFKATGDDTVAFTRTPEVSGEPIDPTACPRGCCRLAFSDGPPHPS